MAWDHSSWRPQVFTGLGVAPRAANAVVPNSPASQGLHTSTVHSSLAFWSTTPLPEEKLKLGGWSCGSRVVVGRQLLWLGAGSLANATFSVWLIPFDTE